MSLIMIGSRALCIRAPNLLTRKPKDFDFISSMEDFNTWLKTNKSKIEIKKVYEEKGKMIVEGDSNLEFEIIKENHSSQLFEKLVQEDKDTLETSFGLIPNLDILFTLKTSHRYLKNSPHVFKNLQDWHAMRAFGAKVRPEYQQFLKMREEETYARQKHPSLTKQTKESFFSEEHGIIYLYDHDSLHESIKHLDMPAYKYYAKDGDPIKSDKAKFFALDEKIRLYGALEEASVLALERALIPHFEKWQSPKQAWLFAFSKVITSITSGWFRQWCYENAPMIIKNYPQDFYEKFQQGLENGLVKKL